MTTRPPANRRSHYHRDKQTRRLHHMPQEPLQQRDLTEFAAHRQPVEDEPHANRNGDGEHCSISAIGHRRPAPTEEDSQDGGEEAAVIQHQWGKRYGREPRWSVEP